MGFLGDIFKDALKDAKYAVKDEIRSEIRSDARDAVRGAIQGTKEKVGEAGDAVKDSLTKQDENPAVLQTAPVQATPTIETQVQAVPTQAAPVQTAPAQTAPADTVGEAMANQLDAAQPAVQMMNNIMNDNGVIGKLANAVVDAKMTDQEKAEMKEGLETLSDPTKAEEVKQALRDNSEQIDAKLKEQGYNTEQMTAALNQSAAQTQEMQNPEKML
jgi:hypothetical protein